VGYIFEIKARQEVYCFLFFIAERQSLAMILLDGIRS